MRTYAFDGWSGRDSSDNLSVVLISNSRTGAVHAIRNVLDRESRLAALAYGVALPRTVAIPVHGKPSRSFAATRNRDDVAATAAVGECADAGNRITFELAAHLLAAIRAAESIESSLSVWTGCG